MVLLEAWAAGRACLVNGHCEVLKKHCIKSNAGLWYNNYEEFKECMDLMLSDCRLIESLSRNGERYIEKNYSWEKIEEKYLKMIDYIKDNI